MSSSTKAKPFRIGLDLDGVVANWAGAAQKWFNEKFGYHLPMVPPPSWDWVEEQVKPHEWRALWDEAVPAGFFYFNVKPFPGAVEFVSALGELGDIVILTNRPKISARDTFEWVDTVFSNNAITGMNVFGSGGKEKAQVFCNVLIDDKPANLVGWLEGWQLDASMQQRKAILYDMPYNQPEKFAPAERILEVPFNKDYFARCEGYEEVLAKVREWKNGA